MRLNPRQIRDLCEAIQAAYDRDDLEMMLFRELGRHLQDYVAAGTHPQQVTSLVRAALRQRWVPDLIRAASAARPEHAELKRLAAAPWGQTGPDAPEEGDDSPDPEANASLTCFPIAHMERHDQIVISEDGTLLMVTCGNEARLFHLDSDPSNSSTPLDQPQGFTGRALDITNLPLHERGGMLCRVEFPKHIPSHRRILQALRQGGLYQWDLAEVEGGAAVMIVFHIARESTASATALGFLTASKNPDDT